MTRDDIIRMARESGECQLSDRQFVLHGLEQITRFATIVADAEAKRIYEEGMVTVGHMREQILAEREACAKVCYELPWKDMGHIPSNLAFADAIRARGQA